MKVVRRFAVLAVALAMLIAASAKAQVMQLVPPDAMVVIKVKNIQDVSAKVAMLSQQWGLANIRPELNDPLGTLLTAANLGPGLDKTGEAAVAIMEPKAGGGAMRGGPNMVMLIPVTDFKAFAGALPNSKADGELTTFSMGGGPQQGFVANWGKYAAISPDRENVAAKGAGLQVTGASAKELESKDVIVYANMRMIRKTALPTLQQMKPMMLQGIERAMMNNPGVNPKYAPLMKAYLGQLLAVAEGFLTDAEGATFGVNLTKDGISTTLLTEFDPGSYAGKAFKAMKNSDASFTAGLPDGKYFFFGGSVVDKAGLQMVYDFIAPIEKEVAAMGADGKALGDYIASFKEYMGTVRQVNFGMVAPPANAIGQEGIVQAVSVVVGDTAKMSAAQKKMMASQDELMKLMAAAGMGGKTTATPNAKTVDGVSLDEYKSTFDMKPQTPQEQQMAMMMQMLYGPNGLTAYSGIVGPDRMVGIAGGNDALVTAAVQAAKTNSDALGKGVAAKVAAALPQNRLSTFYVPIDTIATTVLDVMAARGMPGGVKLPPNLPPLGGTIATDGSALRIDGYIPAQTVQSLIAAGMQMWLQGMNGGGAGQPGGL